MLKISDRVRPCRARCSPRSVGRVTRSVESSRSIDRSGDTCWESSPLGPLTRTWPGSTWTSTPEGISMGSLPMRLISLVCPLPDVSEYLAAHVLAPGLVGGHDPARGRDDGRAHAALHARQLIGGDGVAPAGGRDPSQPADHGVAVLCVLERHVQPVELALGRAPGARAGLLLDAIVHDVSLLLEHARHLHVHTRRGDDRLVVVGVKSVAD